jgi:hypothetical protein
MKMIDAGRSVSLRWRVELSNILKVSKDTESSFVVLETSGLTPVSTVNPNKKGFVHKQLMTVQLFGSGKHVVKKLFTRDTDEQELMIQKITEATTKPTI